MPQAHPITIENRAYLQEVTFDKEGAAEPKGDKFTVTFNPQSLKVNFSNQKAGGDQTGASAIQFVGRGTTKLSVELLFDVTVPQPDGKFFTDVGELLKNVEKFIKPDTTKNMSKKKDEQAFVPPGVRFQWGKFSFDGVVDSIDETMDFFSNDGRPLRATVSLSISRQEIMPRVPDSGSPGTAPLELANENESLQQLMGRLGRGRDWPGVAAKNNIDNPRQVPPGTPLDVSGPGIGVSAGVGISAGISAGVSGGISTGVAAKLDVGVAGRLGFGASSRASVSASTSSGASIGASASAGAQTF